MPQGNATGTLRRRAARGTDTDRHAPFAVRGRGSDRVGDQTRCGRRGRAVGHDSRQVSKVTAVAVRVTGGLRVSLVLVEREAGRDERDEQNRSQCQGPAQPHHAYIGHANAN